MPSIVQPHFCDSRGRLVASHSARTVGLHAEKFVQ